MNTLEYIVTKYGLKFGRHTPMPIEIPNVGRDDLARLFCELVFEAGAEIGVLKGQYAETLCHENQKAKIYGVDPWRAYEGYKDFGHQDALDRFHAEAQARLASYNCSLICAFSAEAVKKFADKSLDFVYIDGNHSLPYVIEDIHLWSAKVRSGGIVSGHDYYKMRTLPGHVIGAVHAWTAAYQIKPWFVLGRLEKGLGEIRDWSRSWMWVK